MPQAHQYHVAPTEDGHWLARFSDDGHAEAFESKQAAVTRVTDEARSHLPSQVWVHRWDGSVEERHVWEPCHEEPEAAPLPSKLNLLGHPVHPMLIPFPIGFLTLLALSDIGFWVTGEEFWARASWYLVVLGLASGGLAALAGLVDFVALKRVRSKPAGWFHLLTVVGSLSLVVVNLMLRMKDYVGAVVPSGAILSFVTFGLLCAAGWFGGELSYRYKIGMTEPE